MATFNMILDPLVYIFFRRENLEWLFRFIRKKRGKSSKPSEESSSASAKTDETNRSATNLEKIQPEFSGAVTTWLTCCIHPNVLSEIQREDSKRALISYHVMWSCLVYPETNREKHASGQSAPWDRKLVSPGILDSLNSGMYHQYCGSFVLINMFSCNHADSHSSEWCLILQLKTYQDSIILNIIFRKNAGCLMYVYQWKIGFFKICYW